MDIEQSEELREYLRRTGREQNPEIRVLAGGVSNRTVLVKRPSGESWVIKQALDRLRVPVPWFSDPRRTEREAIGLEWLGRLAPPGTIPRLVFEDPEHHLFAMEAVPEPHENWKSMLLAGRLEMTHVEQFGELVGAIHRNARSHPEAPRVFEDRSFFESLRLDPYYRYTASEVPGAAGFLGALIEETLQSRLTLVHGDYSPKNILVRQGRLVLLDHEVIHWGDPAFDIGFSTAHFLAKAVHRSDGRYAQAVRSYWRAYQDSFDMEARAVRHALGCLLARVAGKSRLEYLAAETRSRIRNFVVALVQSPPPTMGDLTHEIEQHSRP